MNYPRNISKSIQDIIARAPVLLLNGARQTGKSTIVEAIGKIPPGIDYITLDDPLRLLSASRSPNNFISDLPERVIIDEIQRAPEIFLAIKRSIDGNRKPGRFILTGSANVLVLPKISESLAGRMILKTLWPLSQGELLSRKEDFITTIFSSKPAKITSSLTWAELTKIITTGGYPEIIANQDRLYRQEWFKSYIQTLVERDVKEFVHIDGLRTFPALLSLLSNRGSMPVNLADIGRLAELPKTSLSRYIGLLEALFLITFLPAWFKNQEKRLVKSPKLIFTDNGILCHLSQKSAELLQNDRSKAGAVMENFVAAELLKQLSWSSTRAQLYHYRTHNGQEVDFVLENDMQQVVGIEVKCSNTIQQHDLRGLQSLKESSKGDFLRGVILYTGNETISIDKDLLAMPISSLWEANWIDAESIFE
jgi:predicted AAA+ superfamily ATPase